MRVPAKPEDRLLERCVNMSLSILPDLSVCPRRHSWPNLGRGP